MILSVRNVGQALPVGIKYLMEHGRVEQSRAGPVLVAPQPVMTSYSHPTERVLFSPGRDANPFFHLIEAVWMLAGRDDSGFLTPYVPRYASYAEPTGEVHGAYGLRWRSQFGFDQLAAVAVRLRRDPTTRQAVIAMWDPSCPTGANDLQGDWHDRPCNTHLYLRVRENVLDMTVCCRSNDVLWGAYGANVVHFSVLQECLAAMSGFEVGYLHQLSNNYHVYLGVLDKMKARSITMGEASLFENDGWYQTQRPIPSFGTTHDELFAAETVAWMIKMVQEGGPSGLSFDTEHPLLNDALLAAVSHRHHKEGETNRAIEIAEQMVMPDWRRACMNWLFRHRIGL